MKNKIFPFVLFCIILLMIFTSCSDYKIKNTNNSGMNNFQNNDKSIIWIKALVYVETNNNQKDYILIEKPESKSRVSYHLLGLKTEQIVLLEKLNGKMIEAQIKVIEELSPWNKKALLLNIKY